MKRISIERYPNPVELGTAGLVEGERDDGSTWIMFLDEHGSPQCFWADRDEDGGAVGEPILLGAAMP